MENDDVIITSAFRTAIGSFNGSLSSKTAPELGSAVIKKCIENSESLEDNLLWDAACELDIRTFYGHFKIDKLTGRQLAHTMPVVQWCGDEKRIVWPL